MGSSERNFIHKAIVIRKSGKIILNTKNLTVANGAGIDSSTFGTGNAGNVTVNATETVSLEGKGRDGGNGVISSSVELGAIGKGGEVNVNATNLFLTKGAQILSATFGEGNAGSVTINVVDTVSLDGGGKDGFNSAIGSGVDLGAVGNGGKVFINAKHLLLTDGAAVTSTTRSDGHAGDVIIRTSDSVELSGVSEFGRSGLSTTAIQGNGNSGNIEVFTDKLIVSDGANSNASNFSSIEDLEEPGTGESGSVRIEANSLRLENGRINAATQAGDDGNITLKVADDIILRDNSLISVRALKEATGGNIDLDARFIVAFPEQNNDIIASAERGTGGNIDIIAEAVFGIEERSSTPTNQTNDIDASSQFGLSGKVNITQPTVDPASGLVDLTQEVVDPSKLIAQNVCTQTANSEFIDIGKGGLPKNPEYVLTGEAIEVGLVAPIMTSSEVTESSTERAEVKPKRTRKPPAQGWIFHENGLVELVGYNPHQVGEQRSWDNSKGCR